MTWKSFWWKAKDKKLMAGKIKRRSKTWDVYNLKTREKQRKNKKIGKKEEKGKNTIF